jgi:hypothetical protein
MENPEPRYTLECYPLIIVAAAALFIGKSNRTNRNTASTRPSACNEAYEGPCSNVQNANPLKNKLECCGFKVAQ